MAAALSGSRGVLCIPGLVAPAHPLHQNSPPSQEPRPHAPRGVDTEAGLRSRLAGPSQAVVWPGPEQSQAKQCRTGPLFSLRQPAPKPAQVRSLPFLRSSLLPVGRK